MRHNETTYQRDGDAADSSVQGRLQRNKRDVILAVILTLVAGAAIIASMAT